MSAPGRTLWGWHQLPDDWADRLVRHNGTAPGELALDIGAGHGAITDALLRAGAHVVAVELHPRRVALLRQKYVGADVRVVAADVTRLRLPRQPFVVVANPPFATTTALLKLLLAPHGSMVRADLVVPHHVATRWSQGRGADERRWGDRFSAERTMRIPRTAFRPPAPDDAALLSIRPVRRRRR